TYAARDASWAVGTGPNGELAPADVSSQINVFWQHGGVGPVYSLNARPDATTQLGKSDSAGGLVYYDMVARAGAGTRAAGADAFGGGQVVVDARSGTVSFPQIPPGRADTILVTYQPLVMRINTSRDESNAVRTLLPASWINDSAFAVHPA